MKSPFNAGAAVRLRAAIATLAAALTLYAARARADPLNPSAFPSLGNVTIPTGTYTLNTGESLFDTPTLTVGSTVYHGTVVLQSTTFNPHVAVFDFDQLTINADTTLNVIGNRPLALLSRGNISIAGNSQIALAPGGAGGGFGSSSTLPGNGPGTGDYNPPQTSGGGGGGYGGHGGGPVGPTGDPIPSFGGAPYGNLFTALQGGSGGGHSGPARGGNGGGAIELGALGEIHFEINANIDAPGGPGADAPTNNDGAGGGGSGGGILLHAQTIVLNPDAFLTATGGFGGYAAVWHGGGGGGGRVAIAPDVYTVGTDSFEDNVQLRGGPGGAGGFESFHVAEAGERGVLHVSPGITIVPNHQVFVLNEGKLPTGEEFTLNGLIVEPGGTAAIAGIYTANGPITVESHGLFTANNEIDTMYPVTVGRGASFSAGRAVTASNTWELREGLVSAYEGITFTGMGGVTGNGIIAGSVSIPRDTFPNLTAVLVDRSTLTLGDANSPNGVDIDRPISITRNSNTGPTTPTLLLLDADRAMIGQTTLAARTVLQAPNGITLRSGRQFTGADGAVVAGNFTNQGTVAGPTAAGQFLTFNDDVDGPGSFTGNIRHRGIFAPAPASTIPAGTNLLFEPSAGLRVTIAPNTTQLRLKSDGAAVLAGTLQIVTEGSFTPAPLQPYPILSANSRSGVFTTYTGTDAGKGLLYAPIYSDTGLTLIPTLAGDANVDGRVDFLDLVALAQHYNTNAGNLWPAGDFTYDAAVDFNDLFLLAQHYNTSIYNPAAPPTAAGDFARDWSVAQAPEPSAMSLLLLAAPLLAHRRGRSDKESGPRPAR